MVAAQQAFRAVVKVKAPITAAPEALRQRIRQDISRARLVNQAQRYGVYAAVAASVAGIASVAYVKGSPDPIGVEDLTRYSREVRGLAVDFDPASGNLADWTRNHVDFNPRVPQLRSVEYPLRGVRQYPVRDHKGLVFVWPRSTLQIFPETVIDVSGQRRRIGDRDVVLANHQGFNVAYWRDGGLVYSLVTDLDESTAVQLLQQLEAR
jgi:anti-sigma factor RsiW